MNRNYTRGRAREWDVIELKRARGYWCMRAAGSKGEADVIALKDGFDTELIEVKATKTPFSGFGPSDRTELLAAAERAGATPLLCWWPYDRAGPRWLPSTAWPKIRK